MTIYTYHYANVSGGLGHHDMHTSRKLKLVTSTNSLISTSRGEISTINNWHYYKVQSNLFIKTNLGYISGNSSFMLLKLSESTTMKIEKDKFNSLSEKDQNLQLLRVRRFLLKFDIQIDSSKRKKLSLYST